MLIHALLATAAFGWVPGDGIKSVSISLVPLSCTVRFVDEGVSIDAFGYGNEGLALYAEARRLVQDQSAPPGTLSPIEQCTRAAKATCGAAGVKSVVVTANPDSCSFECYPPSTSPIPPVGPVVPPTTGDRG